ncbi:sugar phosphate isomerase/epimerase family protein [Dyella jiangningensis]|uniref:Xylose isomerase n=1 Tax=Dyella jiangningensis TaxID=1379159 RepID=A0A328P6J8_9GAMM|nr:sugar phosphate isomerase/epimerase family protein [Dyella jiangningensis]RAO77897.1 xylose isomerase [Dyella jiangningensis]
MRLSISNIAWDPSEDEGVAALLARYAVDAIDVAPGKYFSEPGLATVAEIAAVKSWWKERGVEITGMQALLFGTTGLNLFGPAEVRRKMLDHLCAICRIAQGLGASRLVFGSPRNRDRLDLSDEQVDEIAVSFFRELGDVAQAHGVVICLEPNPERYGANFMTTAEETVRVVELVDHPAIRMQLDTGALTINREQPAEALERCAQFIGHVHASEPDLVPLGDGATDHRLIHSLLREQLPDHVVVIEMLATKDEPHLIAIDRAVGRAVEWYRVPNRSVS